MNPDKFVKWITSQTKDLVCKDVAKKLRLLGFKFYRSGGYKRVYFNPKYPKFVIKVYIFDDGWEEDSYIPPKLIKKYYLKPFFQDKRFIIQEKVNKVGHIKAREFFDYHKYNHKFATYDVCGINVAWHKNKPVIIDFLN